MATERDLTVGMQQEVIADKLFPILFFEGAYHAAGSPSIEYLRVWTGIGNLQWDGVWWRGAGAIMKISPIEESGRVEAIGFSVTLSGESPADLSVALSSVRQGMSGKLWLGCLKQSAYLSLPNLSNNYASTPHATVNSITGDIDIRVIAAADDWTPAAEHRFLSHDGGAGNRGWLFVLNTAGRLSFQATQDGTTFNLSTTSTVAVTAVGATNGSKFGVRVTRDSATGTIKFWYSTDNGVNWTQLGTDTTDDTGALYATTGDVKTDSAAGGSFAGKIYRAQIYNGIGGTLAVDFDATRMSGVTGTMATGEVWTINQNASGSPLDYARIIDEGALVVADPYLLQQGRFDTVITNDDGENCSLQFNYESRLIDLLKPRLRRYTSADHQIDHPGDLGFNMVPELQDMEILFGGSAAAASPVATPAPSGGNDDSGPSENNGD